MGHCRVHSCDWGLSAYYLTHRWVSFLSGLLAYGAGPHSSHKDSFCLWKDAKLLLLKAGHEQRTSYSAMMLISLHPLPCLMTLVLQTAANH